MASVLEDGWLDIFDKQLGPFARLLSSYGFWLASGSHAGNPLVERLRYAHALIAEAYSEPSDRIRLVRLISALKAVALLVGKDKAHELASRCASVGGSGDTQLAVEIFDAVKDAYRWRSAVVHGDAPQLEAVRAAFFALERHVLNIVLGFKALLAEIYADSRSQSIRPLRRELRRRIDMFFWDLDLAA